MSKPLGAGASAEGPKARKCELLWKLSGKMAFLGMSLEGVFARILKFSFEFFQIGGGASERLHFFS